MDSFAVISNIMVNYDMLWEAKFVVFRQTNKNCFFTSNFHRKLPVLMRELAWGQGQTFLDFLLSPVSSRHTSCCVVQKSQSRLFLGHLFSSFSFLSEVKFELILWNNIIFLIFSLVWGSANLSLVLLFRCSWRCLQPQLVQLCNSEKTKLQTFVPYCI